ncbi:magnesium transporter CorA family protein [archaeon]
MSQTLIFRKGGDVTLLHDDHIKEKKDYVTWMHLGPNEKLIDATIKAFGQDEDFREDFLEEQRPRLANFKNFSVVVFTAPTKTGVVQLSFIISKNKVISVANEVTDLIDLVTKELIDENEKLSPSEILSHIIDEAIEASIDLIEDQEKWADGLELSVLRNQKLNQGRIQDLRVDAFSNAKLFRADLEVIREILDGEAKFVKASEFDENHEDRVLFAIDELDTIKESVTNITNMHLANLSHRMNESMHKLTIVGSILLIPAVVASVFGMNVTLPALGFWEIMLGSLGVALVMVGVLKSFKWI